MPLKNTILGEGEVFKKKRLLGFFAMVPKEN